MSSLYYRTAGVQLLDEGMVESLRKDFLTLMKNLPRVKDYTDADKLREGIARYNNKFHEFFFEDFVNRSLRYDQDLPLSESDRKYIENKFRKVAWDFYIEFRLPLNRPNEYYSAESRFLQYEEAKDAWSARVKKRAQIFWKEVREVLDWYNRRFETKGIPVKVRDFDQVQMEGIPVVIMGFDQSQESDRVALTKFKEAIKVYKRKAQAVLPWLLKMQLPIHLRFDSINIDDGGRYEGDHIEVSATSNITNAGTGWLTQVLAHEMGHHLYKSLDTATQKFWHETIWGDFGPIDIQEVLDVWPESLTYPDQFVEYLSKKDPVLALQIEVADFGESQGGRGGIKKREDLVKMLERGDKLIVPKNPVTGYGGKNPEEAFCETIGLLVAYGPRAVLPQIKRWLEVAVPEVRLASELDTRVAFRYAARLLR
jgi:hypothetical protein